MAEQDTRTTVGQLPSRESTSGSVVPRVSTRLVWTLFVASLAALVGQHWYGVEWGVSGVVAIDGLTTLLWVVVTFFSGIVHSYSRRYLAETKHEDRFFGRVLSFTLVVMVLVAADHIALFALAWLAMGLVMASLVGHIKGWEQAQRAASLARRYFLASSALLTVALGTLWWATGATTVSGIADAAGTLSTTTIVAAAGMLLLAAMIQSALVPFHTWLLSSMTAPTPASALMHAGFVNAGGILLTRFAPVVSLDGTVMLLIVTVGAASALLGKLLKTVQTDIKGKLGCSTVGQMGFMIMQAGLGFFGAAVTHLVLHGFYKAYQFLSSGSAVEQTTPTESGAETTSLGVFGAVMTVLTGLAGGAVFALLTGKGTKIDTGLLLTLFVVMTTLHAARGAVRHSSLPPAVRYGAVAAVFLPAIAIYAGAYQLMTGLMTGVPIVTAPTELTALHGVVAAVFLAAYVAIETGLYKRSHRLYVSLLNATQPPSSAVLTTTEEYNEY